MAYYRILHDCRDGAAVYRAGDVLDLGDPVYAAQLGQRLGQVLLSLGNAKPEMPAAAAEPELVAVSAPEPEAPLPAAAPVAVVVEPPSAPRQPRRKRR